MLKKALILFVSISLSVFAYADPLPIDLLNEIEQVEEFPIEIDALEEFIQSYYILLESDEYLKGFKFLKQDKNVIHNAEKTLAPFFYKLMELRSGLREQVTVFQIGDSHIKPGFFSTTARSALIKYFQNGSGSLQYQFMAVNGGSYQNLLANEAIFKRCEELNPDLIIVSLGTNDAQGTYNADRFRRELTSYMEKLKQHQGNAAILFTLPPDTNKRGKHNGDVERVSDEIVEYAIEHGHSWWDLAVVMGGKNSIQKWRAEDFASKDLIHFSPKGYMLQGNLFYNALMKGYKDFTEGKR
jgi:lysophospholipase L1-like esterase